MKHVLSVFLFCLIPFSMHAQVREFAESILSKTHQRKDSVTFRIMIPAAMLGDDLNAMGVIFVKKDDSVAGYLGYEFLCGYIFVFEETFPGTGKDYAVTFEFFSGMYGSWKIRMETEGKNRTVERLDP